MASGRLGGLCPKCVAGLVLDYLKEDSPPGLSAGVFDPAHPEGRRFGDYELLEELGRGGMGIVYKARQVSLNRIVAVKMLLHGCFSSADYVKRFYAEAEAAASLQHPNLVAIHEIGTIEGMHYFSMEYVEGTSLAAVVREGPLAPARAARYVELLARAIQYAHDRGILHRDLKPSNIILDQSDGPRITDFGLAKRLSADSDLTITGQVLGAPAYIAPEQAAGKRAEVGVRSDVYALGAILYFLLAGRPPFVAETLPEVLMQVQTQSPAPLLDPEIPTPLRAICLTCLEKDPACRYDSALALAEDIRHWLAGGPVLAAVRQPHENVLAKGARVRRTALLTVAFVLALVVILVESAAHRNKDHSAPGALALQPPQNSVPPETNATAAKQSLPTRPGVRVVWTMGPSLPSVYDEISAAVVEGRLYVVGGRTGEGEDARCVSEVQTYDPETDQWSQAPPLPAALAAVGVAAHNGFLYCFGGIREPYWWGYPVNSAYRFDPRRREWTRLPDMPIARSNFALGVFLDRIYCAGGSIYWPDATSRIDAYEPDTDQWIHSGVMPQSRGSFSGGFWRGRFVLFPGLPSAKLPRDDSVLVFDAANRSFARIASLPLARASQQLFLFADDSGAYFFESTSEVGDSPSSSRICWLNAESGEIQLCEPASPYATSPVAVAAYDPIRSVVCLLGGDTSTPEAATLQKVRVTAASEADH